MNCFKGPNLTHFRGGLDNQLVENDRYFKDNFYFMFEREIQIWPKVFLKVVTMQCIKMETHAEACYSCKITTTNNFFSILVTSIHKTNSFLL